MLIHKDRKCESCGKWLSSSFKAANIFTILKDTNFSNIKTGIFLSYFKNSIFEFCEFWDPDNSNSRNMTKNELPVVRNLELPAKRNIKNPSPKTFGLFYAWKHRNTQKISQGFEQ